MKGSRKQKPGTGAGGGKREPPEEKKRNGGTDNGRNGAWGKRRLNSS
jgi:hypothetical protein